MSLDHGKVEFDEFQGCIKKVIFDELSFYELYFRRLCVLRIIWSKLWWVENKCREKIIDMTMHHRKIESCYHEVFQEKIVNRNKTRFCQFCLKCFQKSCFITKFTIQNKPARFIPSQLWTAFLFVTLFFDEVNNHALDDNNKT